MKNLVIDMPMSTNHNGRITIITPVSGRGPKAEKGEQIREMVKKYAIEMSEEG